MLRARLWLVLLCGLTGSCMHPESKEVLPDGEVGSAASIQWRTRFAIDNPSPGTGDHFGYSAAVNDRFIVVAATDDDEGAINSAGSVYVFDAFDGALLVRIVSPIPETAGQFGTSVALNGDLLVITSQYTDVSPGDDAGRAWLFDAATGLHLADLGGGDAPMAFYGWHAAIGDQFIAIGARNGTPSGVSGAGSVSLFELDGTPAGAFESPNPVIQGEFGRAVALTGTRLVVGAPSETLGTDVKAGRVYAFHVRTGQELFQIQNPGILPMSDEFGGDLATAGSLAAIAGDGLVYLVDLDTGEFVGQFDPLGPQSLDLDGATLIAGTTGGSGTVAQLFDVATGAMLLQINGDTTGSVGGISNNVDVNGNIAVAGAPGDDVGIVDRAGRAYVLERNTSPNANGQSIATTEEVAAPVTLTGNDGQGDALTYVVVNGPVSGTLSGSPPALTYTPNANFHGTDFFTFKASEQPSGVLESDPATVLIEVSSVDDLPSASNDALTLPEDTVSTVAVLTNDGGFGDGPVTVSVLSAPANGEALALSGNTIRYAPVRDYAGSDSFTYRITDSDGDAASATVNVTVQAANDAPVAADDAYTTNEDQALVVAAGAGVLVNDTDVDGPTASAAVVVPPASGSLSLAANGSFTYTPNANFSGTDVFTYTRFDGTLTSASATVVLHVTAVDDLPSAQNDAISVSEDGFVNVAVLSNDSNLGDGSISVTITTAPTDGLAIALSGGLVRYTPNADFAGSDTIGYTVTDADGDSSAATVAVTVNGVADAPVALDDAFSLDEDETLVVAAASGVLANDDDADGSALTVQVVLSPANGVLTLAADGSFTYTPDSNFGGADFFSYQVSDGAASSLATVILSVASVADAPTEPVLLAPVAGDEVKKAFTFSWAPAIDPDGDPVEYSIEVLEEGVPVASATSLVTTLVLDEPLSKGDYTWTVEASDPAGNSTISEAASFTVKGSGGGGGGCSIASTRSTPPVWVSLLAVVALLIRRRTSWVRNAVNG